MFDVVDGDQVRHGSHKYQSPSISLGAVSAYVIPEIETFSCKSSKLDKTIPVVKLHAS